VRIFLILTLATRGFASSTIDTNNASAFGASTSTNGNGNGVSAIIANNCYGISYDGECLHKMPTTAQAKASSVTGWLPTLPSAVTATQPKALG
jgi:hypothetical protein